MSEFQTNGELMRIRGHVRDLQTIAAVCGEALSDDFNRFSAVAAEAARIARAVSASSTCWSGARDAGLRAIHFGIVSPAMPPNTVELATPLPPRRLAPCTPPVSSPAA